MKTLEVTTLDGADVLTGADAKDDISSLVQVMDPSPEAPCHNRAEERNSVRSEFRKSKNMGIGRHTRS